MKKPKLILRNQQASMLKLTLISLLSVFFLSICIQLKAQKRPANEAQWKSVGGTIVASGTYHFKQSDPASGVLVGTFTVQGPGYLGATYRNFKCSSAFAHLRESIKGAGSYIVRPLGSQDLLGSDGNWKWYPPSMITEDYKPNANKGGWVTWPTIDKPTITFDVWATVEGGGIKNDERAIQYEFWYFPQEGGSVISSTFSSGSDKPMPGDLYYIDKECK